MSRFRSAPLLLVMTCVILLFTITTGCQSKAPIDTVSIPVNTATTPLGRLGSDDGWWLRRFHRFNEIADAGDTDLVFLGDSITQNWEDNGKKVWQKYYGDRKAANFGINSDRTEHVLYRVLNGNFSNIKPKLVVLMIGTNNRTPPQETADGVIAIVKAIHDITPQTKILLLAIFPRGFEPGDSNRADNAVASKIFSRVADNKTIFYMDLADKYLSPDNSLSKDNMYDSVHLTPKGYEIWAQAIEPTVRKLLGED